MVPTWAQINHFSSHKSIDCFADSKPYFRFATCLNWRSPKFDCYDKSQNEDNLKNVLKSNGVGTKHFLFPFLHIFSTKFRNQSIKEQFSDTASFPCRPKAMIMSFQHQFRHQLINPIPAQKRASTEPRKLFTSFHHFSVQFQIFQLVTSPHFHGQILFCFEAYFIEMIVED